MPPKQKKPNQTTARTEKTSDKTKTKPDKPEKTTDKTKTKPDKPEKTKADKTKPNKTDKTKTKTDKAGKTEKPDKTKPNKTEKPDKAKPKKKENLDKSTNTKKEKKQTDLAQKQETAKDTFYKITKNFDKNQKNSVADLVIQAYNGKLQMSEKEYQDLQYFRLSDFLEEFKKRDTQPISKDMQVKDIISLIILHLFVHEYNLKNDSKRSFDSIELELLNEFKESYQSGQDKLQIEHYYVYKYFEMLKQYYKDKQQITDFLDNVHHLSIAECTLFLNIIIQAPLNLQIDEDYQKNEYLIFYCSQFT